MPDEVTVKFVKAAGTGWTVFHTFTKSDDWSMVAIENLYINVDFLRFSVLEFDGWEDILSQTEGIYFEGIVYRIERQHRPIGLNRVWTFKLEPIEDYKNSIVIDP